MERRIDEALLGAFVDHELNPAETARIAALAAIDRELAHRIRAIVEVSRLVRAVHADLAGKSRRTE